MIVIPQPLLIAEAVALVAAFVVAGVVHLVQRGRRR